MKLRTFCSSLVLFGLATAVSAQPAYEAPPPPRTVVHDASLRRQQYLERVHQVITWRADMVKRGAKQLDMAGIASNLVLHRNIEACNERVIEMMKDPGTGPFWMFPTVCVAFLGRDELSPEAQAAIRNAWRTTYQIRGDTENHWAMYYISLYLMSEMYPDQPADSWVNGKSSAESLEEARSYLIDWMKLATTVGQGEFNPYHYIGEYAIPLLFLSSWAQDPAMRIRGHMMLDWIFAGLAESTLNGVLHAPNARADEASVIEHSKALSSYFCWLLFGNTPPPKNFGGWGYYFAVAASNYHVPGVIYLIATDRDKPFLQRDLARSRRRWRYSDRLFMPVYKSNYTTKDYAVGSYQGGIADPIQTHVWDVTWDVPDPRGKHNTLFSMHPFTSNRALQMYFPAYPDTMAEDVTKQGKPSFNSPDKLMGCSPYEKVFQNLDTIIALYDIPEGVKFPRINGFFSQGLKHVTEDDSGWIFAQGEDTYLAYRPLADYYWEPYAGYDGGWAKEKERTGDRVLVSKHLHNGTIVQAASASEFASFDAFKAAMRALPLSYKLDPVPTVTLTTLRGNEITFTYGETPMVNGQPVDYSQWQLFEGPYLNARKGSQKLTITHGRLQRVLDFKTLTISDSVTQP